MGEGWIWWRVNRASNWIWGSQGKRTGIFFEGRNRRREVCRRVSVLGIKETIRHQQYPLIRFPRGARNAMAGAEKSMIITRLVSIYAADSWPTLP